MESIRQKVKLLHTVPVLVCNIMPFQECLLSLYLCPLRLRILHIVLDATHLLTTKGVGGGQADIVGMMIGMSV